MTNPYQVTSGSSSDGKNRPSLLWALLLGLVGYLAPTLILFGLSWMLHSWPVAAENLARVIYLHQKIQLAGLAAIAPNLACMGLFAVAGFRRCFQIRPGDLWDPLALGLSVLVGYAVMLLITSVWFPLPWTWSAERANLIRLGIVSLAPLTVIAIRWMVIRSKR